MSDPDPPLVTPRKLAESLAGRHGISPGEMALPGTAVVTPVFPLFRRLVKLFGAEPLKAWSWKSPPVCHYVSGGRRGVLAHCPMGAANVAVILEEFAAFGVREAFFLGLAGGIGTRHAPGDLLLPPYARVGEGVSRYYGNRPLSFPDKRLYAELLVEFGRKCRVYQNAVFSTDGLYRETRRLVREVTARGVGAIDMETSAFFSVSQTVSIRGAALLWVTDLLEEDGWEPHFFDKRLRWSLNAHFKRFRDWLLEARGEV